MDSKEKYETFERSIVKVVSDNGITNFYNYFYNERKDVTSSSLDLFAHVINTFVFLPVVNFTKKGNFTKEYSFFENQIKSKMKDGASLDDKYINDWVNFISENNEINDFFDYLFDLINFNKGVYKNEIKLNLITNKIEEICKYFNNEYQDNAEIQEKNKKLLTEILKELKDKYTDVENKLNLEAHIKKEREKEAKSFDSETKRNKENRKNELNKNCKEEINKIRENESILIEEIKNKIKEIQENYSIKIKEIQENNSIKIKEIQENYSIQIEDELNKLEAKREKEKVAYLNDKEKSIRERIKKENLAKQQEQESDFNKFKKILSIDPKNKDAIDKMRKLAQEKYEPAIKYLDAMEKPKKKLPPIIGAKKS